MSDGSRDATGKASWWSWMPVFGTEKKEEKGNGNVLNQEECASVMTVEVDSPTQEKKRSLDLSVPAGSNGVIAGWISRIAAFMSELEEREKAQALIGDGTHGEGAVGPWTLGLFALSSLGMLTVGFKIGVNREIERDVSKTVPGSLRDRMNQQLNLQEPANTGASLRDRVNQQKAQAQQLEKQVPAAIESSSATVKKKPPPPNAAATAFRALGLATVLTLSTATFIGVTATWYFDLASTEDLIFRLKRNVPRHSDTIRGVVGGPLESLRDSMQGLFSKLRPAIAPEGSDGDVTKNIQKEKEELNKLGFDADYWLDEAPAPVKDVKAPVFSK